MPTNANKLALTRIHALSIRDIAVVPKGRIGAEDKDGRRKVVWQWSEKKIYVVCLSCGEIGHYELEESVILGRDLYTGGCIVCGLCKIHSFVLLKGAGAVFARSIRKNPETCPCCGHFHSVSAYHQRYVERGPKGEPNRIYSRSFFRCADCWIHWEDPRSGAKLEKIVRMG